MNYQEQVFRKSEITGGKIIFKGNAGDDHFIYQTPGRSQSWFSVDANGGTGSDALYGGTLSDTLRGGAGDYADYLYGRDGMDFLYGEGGNDLLDGGRDGWQDALWGGPGRDEFRWDRSPTNSMINRDYPMDYEPGEVIHQ